MDFMLRLGWGLAWPKNWTSWAKSGAWKFCHFGFTFGEAPGPLSSRRSPQGVRTFYFRQKFARLTHHLAKAFFLFLPKLGHGEVGGCR